MTELNTTVTETTVETPGAAEAPGVTKPVKKKVEKPAKAAPLLKLSSRQRSNVDALDNGLSTSASVINHVLAVAGRPLSTSELTELSVAAAPDKFTKETSHGRVANHVRHLLKRRLVENTGGKWRLVGAIGAATKILKETATAKTKKVVQKAPKGEAPAAEPETPKAE